MMNMTWTQPHNPVIPAVLGGLMAEERRERDGLLDARTAGDFIRRRMAERGETVQGLADKIGIGNPSQLSNLLAGRINIARSYHLRAIADVLGLTTAEIEWLNPNIIFVRPDAPPPVLKPEAERPLPAALRSALEMVNKMGQNLSENDVRALLPKGLDGKGPQTEAEWVEFLLFVKKWL